MEEAVLGAIAALGLLGGLGHGPDGGDLVSFLPVDTYLQSRRIPVNIENLMRLATTEPKSGKAQLLQLMALRALGQQPALVQQDAAALRTLEQIAQGEIARDRLGFAQAYARRTLRALGRSVAPARPAEGSDPCAEALGWFPASVTLVAFFGGAPVSDTTGDYGHEVQKFVGFGIRRPRDWDQLFHPSEILGNARIDRVAFAFARDDKDQARGHFRSHHRQGGAPAPGRLAQDAALAASVIISPSGNSTRTARARRLPRPMTGRVTPSR
jgi:hypothetical protein